MRALYFFFIAFVVRTKQCLELLVNSVWKIGTEGIVHLRNLPALIAFALCVKIVLSLRYVLGTKSFCTGRPVCLASAILLSF